MIICLTCYQYVWFGKQLCLTRFQAMTQVCPCLYCGYNVIDLFRFVCVNEDLTVPCVFIVAAAYMISYTIWIACS